MKLLVLFLAAASLHAQPWANIIAPSRATDWTTTGLPSQLVYGSGGTCPGVNCTENLANPWSPPTRTLCTTVNPVTPPSDSSGAINTALNSCNPGTIVSLASGAWTISGRVDMWAHNGITVRGAVGPQSTVMTLTGGGFFEFDGGSAGACTHFDGTNGSPGVYTVGATVLNISGCGVLTPSVGAIIQVGQCPTGTSGWNGSQCVTGAVKDNGVLFTCANSAACFGGTNQQPSQVETMRITAVSGSAGTFTVTVSRGLRGNNFATGNSPMVYGVTNVAPHGMGLENVTLVNAFNLSKEAVNLQNTYGSWAKGIRTIGPYGIELFVGAVNCLVMNNYLSNIAVVQPPAVLGSQVDSDNLMLNNIGDSGLLWQGEGRQTGIILAYNYNRDYIPNDALQLFDHSGLGYYDLYEGNHATSEDDDVTSGGNDGVNTNFRNLYECWKEPYSTSGSTAWCLAWKDFNRFENAVGNVLGDGTITPAFTGYSSDANGLSAGYAYILGGGQFNGVSYDNQVKTTGLRFGNWDTVTEAAHPGNGSRFCASNDASFASAPCSSVSEIPVSINANQFCTASTTPYSCCTGNTTGTCDPSAFNNPNPASRTLPASLFLPVTAHANGGTGLSWWKTCDSWTTFPTSCAHYTTPPFPTTGPDVTGGNHSSGHSYDNPATIAWYNLPVDSAYQYQWKPSSSSWSGGIETISFPIMFGVVNVSESGTTATLASTSGNFPASWTAGTPLGVYCGLSDWTAKVDTLVAISGAGTTTMTATAPISGLSSVNGCYITGFSLHALGPFQLSGVNSACTLNATFNTSNEIFMTTSDAGGLQAGSYSFKYALPVDPGVSCASTVLFPDRRQFDERVYQLDPATAGVPKASKSAIRCAGCKL